MPPVGKSGPLTHFRSVFDFRVGLVDQMQGGVAKLGGVVRRESRSPCPPRCPARHWRAGSETRRAAPPALSTYRRNWDGTRRRPRRCLRAAAARRQSCGLRCSDRQRDYRRRYCRNCPGRRPADSARRNLRQADHGVIDRLSPCGWNEPITSPTILADFVNRHRDRAAAAACRRGCGDAPASARRGRPAARVHDGRERVSEVALFQRVAQHDLVDFRRLFWRYLSFSHKSKSFKSFPTVFQDLWRGSSHIGWETPTGRLTVRELAGYIQKNSFAMAWRPASRPEGRHRRSDPCDHHDQFGYLAAHYRRTRHPSGCR